MKEDKSGFTRYLKQYLSSAINLFPQFYTRVSQLLRPLVSLIALLNNSVIAVPLFILHVAPNPTHTRVLGC